MNAASMSTVSFTRGQGLLRLFNKTLVAAKEIPNAKETHIRNFTRNFHVLRNLSAKVDFKLSDIGEGIKEVQVKEWFVKEGDKVVQFDNICEVQSDKASVTITSRYDGVVTKLHYNVDDIAFVGKPLVEIDTDQDVEETVPEHKEEIPVKTETISETVKTENEPVSRKEDTTTTTTVQFSSNEGGVDQDALNEILCIPSVRRLAKEHKLNLAAIKGTGKNGRILKEDVLKYLETSATTVAPLSKVSVDTVDKKVAISGFQKVMVRTMTESLKIPHFVYSDEIKVTKLSELRKTIRSENDLKLSFMPFFIKSVSNALKKYPVLNSSLDEKIENILYHKDHNIGVAMDTSIGLAVPVIKNVQNLGVMEIAAELKRLMESGKKGNFSPSDLRDGTFTVSNIGMIGGTYLKPVILAPQVAILAIGAAQLLPRFDVNKNVIAEEIVNISASGDHRIIDGATMAHFISIVKRQIESPHLLFLNI